MSCTPLLSQRGTVERIAHYLDCGATQLGREGFLGFAQYTMDSGIFAGALTIFAALFALSLMLGRRLDVPALPLMFGKIGLVFALLLSWPAFQTLFYDVAIYGPEEVTGTFGASSEFDTQDTIGRAQRVYDALRLGTQLGSPQGPIAPQEQAAETQGFQVQSPMPTVATVFIASVVGIGGAFKLAAGFLLSVAPIPIISLLFFGYGLGLFVSWLRALLTTVLATIGIKAVTALQLFAIENEFTRLSLFAQATLPDTIDRQGLILLIAAFGVASLVVVYVSASMTKGLLHFIGAARLTPELGFHSERWMAGSAWSKRTEPSTGDATPAMPSHTSKTDRIERIVQSLDRTVARESKFEMHANNASASSSSVNSGRQSSQAIIIERSNGHSGRSRVIDQRANIRSLQS